MVPQEWRPKKLRLIARGGTALIYESRDAGGNPAALKVSRGSEFDPVVSRETGFDALPDHPARLRIIAHGTDGEGRAWLLLPLLSGETLAGWRGGEQALLQVLAPAADLLDLLHRQGFGHADLKPDNLLAAGDIFLLSDLGLASPLGEVAAGGSPAYLSPSRLDRTPLHWRDDLHSFAVMIYECLAGRLPFAHTAGDALPADIRSGATRSLNLDRPDLPRSLGRLFERTFRGESDAGSVLIWLDQLCEILGMKPSPRSLFMVPGWAEKIVIDSGSLEGDRLAETVTALLTSVSNPSPRLPREERIVLEELIAGRPRRLVTVLEYLLHGHLIHEEGGWISFTEPTCNWRDGLLELLAGSEPAESPLIGTSGGGARREPPISGDLLTSLWRERPTATDRLGLIRDAIGGGKFQWIADLPWSCWLELGEAGSREIQVQLLAPELLDTLPAEIVTRLRIFQFGSYLRQGDPGSAAELFWELERDLDLDSSAELSRRVTYQFLESGRIAEGFDLLKRWQRRRRQEIAGTVLEIRIAARELSALAFFGDLPVVEQRAARYQQEFAGRPGIWYLNMALANLATERSDSREVIRQTRLALSALRLEGGNPVTMVDLLYHLASELMLAGNVEGRDQVPQLLDEAEAGARRLDDPLLIQRLLSARGLWAMGRGKLAEAEGIFRQTIRSAQETGQLDRSRYHRNNLALALFYRGDYRQLQSIIMEMEAAVAGSGALHEHLYTRTILTLFQIEFGDLSGAVREIERILPAAREADSKRIQGLLHLRLALRHHYAGNGPEAIVELRSALEKHRGSGNGEEVLRCRLWLLQLVGGVEGAEELSGIIRDLEGLGAPRHLPQAWNLLAGRLMALKQPEAANRALTGGLKIADWLGNPENLWPLHLQTAELALLQGDTGGAARAASKAVELLRDLSLHFDGKARELYLSRSDRRAVLTRLQYFRAAAGG